MYVCICNALKAKDVQSAVSNGAGKVSEVFQSSGCKADCGRCFKDMRQMIESHDCDNCIKAQAAE